MLNLLDPLEDLLFIGLKIEGHFECFQVLEILVASVEDFVPASQDFDFGVVTVSVEFGDKPEVAGLLEHGLDYLFPSDGVEDVL